MRQAIPFLVLAISLFGMAALLRSARRDPDNWRIDLGRMRPTFNHYKEVALIAILLLFLAAALFLLI